MIDMHMAFDVDHWSPTLPRPETAFWSFMCRGTQLTLTQQQVALVLPGGPFTRADLAAVAAEAAAAAEDPSLCKLAWEVSVLQQKCGHMQSPQEQLGGCKQGHGCVSNSSALCTAIRDTISSLLLCAQVSDTGAVYTAPLMAELLFGGVPDAALCAAAHALLSADRTYFKQTARLPPAFQPRSAAAVAAICAEQAAALQVLSFLSTVNGPQACDPSALFRPICSVLV